MAKKPGTKNNAFLWGLAAFLGLGVAGIVLTIFLNLIQTETYYILNEDVPSRTTISEEMMVPVTVNKGGAPEAAIGLADIQTGNVISSHPLLAGDILTLSNVGTQTDISAGVPDEWVITNFTVAEGSALGGRIQKGYYFDMLVVDGAGGFYPFINVLALDTAVDIAQSSEGGDGAAATSGEYVVAMTPENAAKLHQVVAQYGGNIKLLLSPRQNEYAQPRIGDYEGFFSYTQGDEPINLGAGTDYTFTSLQRDEFGRLIETLVSCGEGNAVIAPQPDESGNLVCPPGSTPTERYTPSIGGNADGESSGSSGNNMGGSLNPSPGATTGTEGTEELPTEEATTAP